jgi:fucose permease
MHGLLIVLFAIAFGFTASGITANSYKLIAKKPETLPARIVYAGVMILAGPNVLFENAATSFRAKKCSTIAFWLAAVVAGYWSFIVGLFVLSLYVAKL